MAFKHYIVTRFNLSQRWDKNKNGGKVLDEDWLENRYHLFDKYCFPSVESQTNQNFEWWVYFDSKTSVKYRLLNSDYQRKLKNFVPKYEDNYDSFELNMPKDIELDALSNEIDIIVTTRLDNDDIISRKFVDNVQAGLGRFFGIIDMQQGYTLELGKVNKLRKFKFALNPFITYVEEIRKNKPIKTVYHREHGHWDTVPIINVSKEPQWIQIVHAENVFNRARGIEVFPFFLQRNFKFNYPVFFDKKGILYLIKLFVIKGKKLLRIKAFLKL